MNLKEIAESSWRQLNPNPSNTPHNSKEEFIASARHLYATEVLAQYRIQKAAEGEFEVPAIVLEEREFDVQDNEIIIPARDILTSLPLEQWLQDVGGDMCGCRYIKTSLNTYKQIGDDDCTGDAKVYYPIGSEEGMKIKFPKGVHKSKLTVIYASKSRKIFDSLEIEDGLAGIIRIKLIDLYGGKTGREDVTNNGNPEN